MKCDYSNKEAIIAKFRDSLGEGVGSILSLQGGYIRKPKGSIASDAEQLRHDWVRVGNCIRSAYKKSDKTTRILNYEKSEKEIG